MEEDHEELLQGTDDESSETEDQCCVDKPEEHRLPPLTYFQHTKVEFLIYQILLIVSTLALLILVPVYISIVNNTGSITSILLVNILISCIILSIVFIILKFLLDKFKNVKVLSPPIKFWRLFQISSLYSLCGLIYFYSSDRNKVLCHLQDPVKGIVLVFALLYYFFFCKNLMGLHRIFATTTIIVGLFVAVDYGLCDEFVCRGYDRKQVSDDAGLWSWKIHSIWTGLYIFGLTLFAACFTLLDRHVLPEDEMMSHNLISNCFVNTISRSITASTSNLVDMQSEENQRQINIQSSRKKSAIHFVLWIHIFTFVIIFATFWIDFIPGIGKGNSPAESWNYTMSGIMCHFSKPGTNNCGAIFWCMLAFQLSYLIFTISSMKFLMISQSAVFTIATMSYALPLVGIWWSLFYTTPSGLLVWFPKIRGEFFCSIIGLPIVSIGLGLLCKAHFADYQRFTTNQSK